MTGLQHCTPQTILRFKGSNTIGGKLLPALAKAYLEQEGYTDIHEASGDKAIEESFIVGERNGHNEQIEIQAQGTKTAFEGLISGSCDIGMASRKIKPEEQQSLKSLGDLTSVASEHVIALDGIALIVHKSNPISSLSIAQVADIFSGTLTDWSQLGGRAGTITIYARNDKSGTYDFFKESVLKAHGKSLASSAQRFEDSNKLSATVSGDITGIGFIGLNYVGLSKVVALSDVGVEARKPSLLTIKTEDYLLSRRLYLYIAENNSNPIVSRFIEFAVGVDGQRVVESVGLVPLDVKPLTALELDSADPRRQSIRWRNLTEAAAEIPTRFRFRPKSNELDSRANRDIGRIVSLMNQPDYRGKKVILIGFADSRGSRNANLELSQNRADSVKKALSEEGVTVLRAEGVGAEAYVASNDTDEGREKNRRVEVWVK